MAEPSLNLGNGNWAGKSGNLLAYHKANNNFYADELTFTRASTGTIVNADGLIEQVPYNLVTYSNDFSQWGSSTRVFRNSGQSGYDGTNDAWLIAPTTTNNTHLVGQVVAGSGIKTISVYAKGGGYNYFSMRDNTSYAKFDLDLGVSATNGAGAISSTINSVGDGWYNCTFTYTKSVDGNVIFYINNTYDYVDAFAGNGTSGVYFQDAQLNSGSTAKTYYPTTTRLNVPRVDYLNNSNGSLLLESQRTNLITYSEDFSNAAWAKSNNPTITSNVSIAPDGTQTADGIQDTTGGSFKRISQSFSVSANSTNTASCFVKKETTQTNFGGLTLTYRNGTIKYAYGMVNPINGTLTIGTDSVIGETSTKVEDFGDYWKFSLTATDNGSNTSVEIAYYATLSTNGTSANTGAGSIRTIWGFQLEIGATYPTSYIPTSGTTVTRLQDTSATTGLSDVIGQTEGTIFVDVDFKTLSGTNMFVSIRPDASNKVEIYRDGSTIYGEFTSSSSFNFNKPSVTVGRYKIAVSYSSGSSAMYINGVLIGSNTTTFAFTSTLDDIAINSRGGSSFIEQSEYKQVQIYKTRLTNTELATLTTI